MDFVLALGEPLQRGHQFAVGSLVDLSAYRQARQAAGGGYRQCPLVRGPAIHREFVAETVAGMTSPAG